MELLGFVNFLLSFLGLSLTSYDSGSKPPCRNDTAGIEGGKLSLIEGRVVNGQPIWIEQVPYQAQVVIVLSPSKGRACGGTIYSKDFIITAAHCFVHSEDIFRPTPNQVTVYVGKTHFKAIDPEQVKLKVTQIIIHENFNRITDFDSDITLLRVSPPIQFNKYMQSIEVASEYPATFHSKGSSAALVSGWGITGKRFVDSSKAKLVPSETLNAGKIRMITRQKCQEEYWAVDASKVYESGRSPEGKTGLISLGTLPNTVFCASTNGTSACDGDSGGPLFCDTPMKLCGVASFGYGCGNGVSNVFTDLIQLLPWIKANAI